MTKITLTDVSNLQNENTAVNVINVNSQVVELAFDNTISRDGTSPNQMEASLDMNSNQILNLPAPTSNYEPIRLIDVDTINGGGITVSPLPSAGTTGQILEKNSNTDYDVSWKDSHEIPVGGSTAQVLSKTSSSNYDAGWSTPHYVPTGGVLGQVLSKNSGTDYDTSWVASSSTVLDSIAQLRALTPAFADNVTVRGYYAKSDGGGGSFYWDTPSVVPDNGGTVIQPNAGGTGRWIRYWSGEKIDVKWFGAKGDGVTSDTAAIANAMTVAIAVKGTLYISSAPVYYLATITIPDGTSGLDIVGDGKGYPSVAGPGSVILNNTASNTLDITSNTGITDNIIVKGIKLLNTGGGYPLHVKQCSWSIYEDLICLSTTGGILIEGAAISSFINIQAYGGTLPALTIQDGNITAAGPFSFIGGEYTIQNNPATTAIAIKGNTYSTSFYNTMYSAAGPNVVAGVTVDGSGVTQNVGTVNFFGCYGESNHNTSNTGCDFLIGNTNKAGSVTIEGNHSHGNGDGTNYQRDFVKIVAAKSVTVKSSLGTKLASTNGYSRGYIRLETTFPAAGDNYTFQNNIADVSGTLYSDANGLITSSTKDEANNAIVRVSGGGTGLTSGTSGGIPYYNSTSTMTPSALLASNALMVGGGAGAAPSTVTTGTGILTALAANVGSAGAPVTFNGALGTPSSGTATNLTGTASGLTSGTVTTNANLTGDVTSVGNATTLTNAPVIAKVLTGYTSGAGTVSATDSILQAIQKLNGNDGTNANLTGDVTSVGNATTLTNAPVIAKVLTGYTSGAGTVSATDSILQAIQKLNGNDATNANLTGDVTSVGNATTLTNAPVIAKVLTGYTSGAGTVSAADSILSAIQKLNGNDATNANLTGVITSVGNATSIASQTGTGTKFVVDTTPTLVTPVLGAATATTINGASIDNLAWTTYSPSVTSAGGGFTNANGGTGSGTGTLTSSSGRYKIFGKTLFWQCQATVNTVGNATGAIIISMPGGTALPAGWLGGLSGATAAGINLAAIINASSFGNSVAILKYDGTTTISASTLVAVSGSVELS